MWRFIGGQDLLRADHDLESPRARAALCQFRYQVRSYFLSCRWVLATPMPGDLVTSADPDPVLAQDMIEEAGKRGGARRLAARRQCKATVIIFGVCSPSRHFFGNEPLSF